MAAALTTMAAALKEIESQTGSSITVVKDTERRVKGKRRAKSNTINQKANTRNQPETRKQIQEAR
eukprot:3157933-Rhodomonas_salina.1